MLRHTESRFFFAHGFRSIRQTVKGALIPRCTNDCPVIIQTNQYIGLRHCDLFMHTNNSRFVEIAELARWEATLPSNFGRDCFQARIWPIVAHVGVNYFRQLAPFQIATVQTCFLCLSGKQFVFLQHIHDGKGNLVATVSSYVSMMNTKNKPISVEEAWQRMGEVNPGRTLESSFVCGATHVTDVEQFRSDSAVQERLQNAHKYPRLASPYSKTAPTFSPRFPETDLLHYESLRSNCEAVALAAQSFAAQRLWNKNARLRGEGK